MSIGLTTSIQGASPEVVKAIQSASKKTGVDFGYLVDQARAESSFRADAKASTSSATGLYQFIDSTWLATVKQHGSKHGLNEFANKIQTDFQGRNFVSNDADKREILNLRNNPEIASVMAAEFASTNQKYLEQKIGRDATSTDLYFAHFLGAGGASKFLGSMQDDPNQSAAALMPRAASANKNIFYNTDGSHKSLMQVYNKFDSKFNNVTEVQVVDNDTIDPDVKDGEIAISGYRVDPKFSRFYSNSVSNFITKSPMVEPLQGNDIFASLFQNTDISRMQNQLIDPVSFLMLTRLDLPK
jgi:hypothetical protein